MRRREELDPPPGLEGADLRPRDLPCGGKAFFDRESSIGGFRCDTCNAVVGSVGMPRRCRELLDAKH